jgi:hypothetical protein
MAINPEMTVTVSDPVTQADMAALQDAHVARLDADMFTADDIDGVTEGLGGSGNLNYLVLQSQQTNESAINSDPFNIDHVDYNAEGVNPFDGGHAPGHWDASGAFSPFNASSDLNSATGLLNVSGPSSYDPAFGVTGGESGGSFTTLGTLGASNFDATFNQNSDTTFDFKSGDDGANGGDGQGHDGENGASGTDGTSGIDGRDGRDGQTPDDPPTPPGDDVDLSLNGISDLAGVNLDVILDPVENVVGDIDINVDGALGNILSTDDGILPNPGTVIDALVGGTEILDGQSLGLVLQPVEDIATGLVETVNPMLSDLLPFLPDSLDLVGGIINGSNAGGDTDLLINGGLGLPDMFGLSGLGSTFLNIPLDPVENILGDTDIDLSANSVVSNLLEGNLSNLLNVGVLSNGEFLSGIDSTVSSDDLTGSANSLFGNITDAVSGNDDIDSIANNLLNGNPVDMLIPGAVTEMVNDIAGGNIIGNPPSMDELNGLVNSVMADIPTDNPAGTVVDLLGDMTGNAVDTSMLDPVTGAIDDIPSGDILGGLMDPLPGGDLPGMDILQPVTDLTESALGDGLPAGDVLSGDLLGELTDSLPTGDLLGGDLLQPVTDLVESVTGDGLPVGDLLGGDLLSGDLLGGLTDSLPTGDLLGGDLLQPVTDLVESVTGDGLPVGDLLGGDFLSGDLLGGLTDSLPTGDLLGGDLLQPVTDLVESVTGDGLPVGDLLGGDLLSGGPLGGLTDSLPTGDLLGGDLLQPVTDLVNSALDGVSSLSDTASGLVGSILDTVSGVTDSDIGLLQPDSSGQGGLGLDSLLGGGLGGLGGGDSAPSWPEAVVGDVLGSDAPDAGGLLGGLTLPEPEGIISEGLHLISDSSGGGGGGLVGGLLGGHHGGLFG